MLRLSLMGRSALGATAAAVVTGLTLSLLGTPAQGADGVAATSSPTSTASTSASPAASWTASASSTASASTSATPSASASPSSSATPAPAPSPSATVAAPVTVPSVAPTPAFVMPTALGSWCTALFPPTSVSAERRAAQELMNGRAKVSDGGTYVLSEHPNWRPQPQTDTSGDRHANSLNWALPLLFRGVRVQNAAMVQRFQQLIHYWIADHQGKRGYWVDGSIYGGLRTQTLVCAAQTLNDPVIAAAAARDARTMLRPNFGVRTVATGTNNTDLIRQLGGYAFGCWVGDTAMRDRGWANIFAVGRGLIHNDGSDVEGSPWYGVYLENLLMDAERAVTTCGSSPTQIQELRARMYDFVAHSVRPDFELESLGDTINRTLPSTFGVGQPRADWVRSKGASGEPPTSVYAKFDGGYVFGRAGWRPQPGGPDTYYSVRFSSSRPRTPHTHDDGGGVTIFSDGVPWITDRGPYRYENSSALRAFVRTRAAHSAVTVGQVSRRWPGVAHVVRATSDWQLGGNDTTCVRDDTWNTVSVMRCVEYIRSVDAIVIVDYVNATAAKGKRAKKRFVWERWHLVPGVGATNTSDTVTLSQGDKRLDIIKAGGGAWSVDVAQSSSSIGWQTGTWGQRLPSAVLNRKSIIGRGAAQQALVTVFVPRSASESVPVTVDASGVTITRGGLTITTPLPKP